MGRRGRAARRGFTLTELLIVVAMVGVMAALALVGYRKYIHSAQSSEAKTVIQMIRGAQEAYKSEMLQYLDVSSSMTNYYPNVTPNDSRYSWVWTAHGDYANWKMLSVAPDGPVRFGYACKAGIGATMPSLSAFSPAPTVPVIPGGVAWFAIQAINDHDHNGRYAVFGSTSLSGEIMSQDEQE